MLRNRSRLRNRSSGGFDPSDYANGTLVLNFVDPAPQTLSLDMTQVTYSQWANDTTASLSGLVGYYQVKG